MIQMMPFDDWTTEQLREFAGHLSNLKEGETWTDADAMLWEMKRRGISDERIMGTQPTWTPRDYTYRP